MTPRRRRRAGVQTPKRAPTKKRAGLRGGRRLSARSERGRLDDGRLEAARGRLEAAPAAGPLVGIIMGSASDRPVMDAAAGILTEMGIAHEVRIVSAHRTPDWAHEYASSAERRGIRVIIAGAGGAAHLAGVTAAKTVIPVIGVPMATEHLGGLDSLLSTVQMPGGVPVATVSIGRAGAANAALLAARILGVSDDGVRERVRRHQQALAAKVRDADRAQETAAEGPSADSTPSRSP